MTIPAVPILETARRQVLDAGQGLTREQVDEVLHLVGRVHVLIIHLVDENPERRGRRQWPASRGRSSVEGCSDNSSSVSPATTGSAGS